MNKKCTINYYVDNARSSLNDFVYVQEVDFKLSIG